MDAMKLNWSDRRALNARRTWHQSRRVCHIPEKGLFFGLRGNVYSCCFNKSYIPGTYPEQSIRQIWTGQMLEQQRKAINSYDLSLGCSGCDELIKSRNINALPILSYDRFAKRNSGYPAKTSCRVAKPKENPISVAQFEPILAKTRITQGFF